SAQTVCHYTTAIPISEYTEGREGFYHLISIHGDVEQAELTYIIRYFDKSAFSERKTFMKQIVQKFQEQYGKENIALEMMDQYYRSEEHTSELQSRFDL